MSVVEMKMPSPGESITEVEIAQWLVDEGSYVALDQVIAEIDSDKATLELTAEVAGSITFAAQDGDAVVVGDVVCKIDTSAEAPVAVAAPAKEAPKAEAAKADPARAVDSDPFPGPDIGAVGQGVPRRRNPASQTSRMGWRD